MTTVNELVAKHPELVADYNRAWNALVDARIAFCEASYDFAQIPAAPSRISGRLDLHAEERSAALAAYAAASDAEVVAGRDLNAAKEALKEVNLWAVVGFYTDRSPARFLLNRED
jgi:hypothetical protein